MVHTADTRINDIILLLQRLQFMGILFIRPSDIERDKTNPSAGQRTGRMNNGGVYFQPITKIASYLHWTYCLVTIGRIPGCKWYRFFPVNKTVVINIIEIRRFSFTQISTVITGLDFPLIIDSTQDYSIGIQLLLIHLYLGVMQHIDILPIIHSIILLFQKNVI